MPVRSEQLLQARDAALGCIHAIKNATDQLGRAWTFSKGKDNCEAFNDIARKHFEAVARQKNALETSLTSSLLIAIEKANAGSETEDIIIFAGKLFTTHHRAVMRAVEVFEEILFERNNRPMPVWVYSLILKVPSEGRKINERELAAYYERVMDEIQEYPIADLKALTAEIRKEYVQASMYTHNFVTPDEKVTFKDSTGYRVSRPERTPPSVFPARLFTSPQKKKIPPKPAATPVARIADRPEPRRKAPQPKTPSKPQLREAPQPQTPSKPPAVENQEKIAPKEASDKQKPPMQERVIVSFPTPDHIRWRDIEITFVSDLQVDIVAGDVHKTCDFIEMGMVDRETGEPDDLWALFRGFCERGSIVAWTAQTKVSAPDATNPNRSETDAFWNKIEIAEAKPVGFRISLGDPQFHSSSGTRSQRVGELRKRLKAYFRIPGDPIELRSEKDDNNTIIKRYWKLAFKTFTLASKTTS